MQIGGEPEFKVLLKCSLEGFVSEGLLFYLSQVNRLGQSFLGWQDW